ncbi:hypothetical protein QPK87_25275 [Kamptonema cortianum]|nr:hypothetical protein [Kamptonema cortianum]
MQEDRISAARMLEIFGDELSPEFGEAMLSNYSTITPEQASELETLVLGAMDRQDEIQRLIDQKDKQISLTFKVIKGLGVALLVGSAAGLVTLLVRPNQHSIGFNYGALAGASGYLVTTLMIQEIRKEIEKKDNET